MYLPEMALVTLISGECRAGITPHTLRYPIKPARPTVKTLLMKTGPVALPKASAPPIVAVTAATSRFAFCHGVKATVGSAAF